jgi:hypothetical protein
MNEIDTAIIPTTLSKLKWLRITLRGLYFQKDVRIEKIHIVVDLKIWDSKTPVEDVEKIIPGGFKFQVDILNPPIKTKRSHQAVNKAIKSINESGNKRVLVMDDDYWFRRTDDLAKLIEKSMPGVFVTPCAFDEVSIDEKSNWLQEPVVERGIIRYFANTDPKTKRIVCDMSERGQHPMCGHPKVFFTEDFMTENGFDVPSFQHYWWCDTDMYYRLKKRFEFVHVPIETWHMDHPRYHPQMFQKPNARRFLERHQAIGEILGPHLEAANNQLME